MSGRIYITGNELTRFENIVINNSFETDAEFHRKIDETIMLAAKAAERQGGKSGKVGKNISHKYPLKNNGYTWNLSAVKEPAIPTPVTTYGVIPIDKNNAASKGKTTIEIYRMAMDMVVYPDRQFIRKGQYIDDTLRAAYEQVQYYFSHPWNAAANGIAANSKRIDPVTFYMYERMIAAIYGNDTNEQKEGIKILEERSKWYNAFSWADLASNIIIPAADLKFLQSAVENVKSLPEGFQLFANAARFRTEAANLNEQIALKEAMSGEGKPIMEGELEDQRLKGKRFTKYQYQKEFKDPMTGKVKRIIIHYLKDSKTGAIFDFKFKDN